ncbi:CHAT domain-containing protein [Microcystis aeruginosa CS-558/01A06]|nr:MULTISPECIES: CHAT domain-containing tetratricopeptide repeat protein [Microcystis]MCA2589905.1 CHAT domain-containing protein [Microcystis sp. M31BS1]MDB9409808.1 CHAT domain-containing protein [Microcystis aeruginosa CS-558/01A06]
MLETKSFSISNHRLFLVKNQQRLAELLTFIDFAEGLTIGFIEVNRNEEANWIVESLMNNSQCQNIQFIVLNIDDSQVRFLLDEILNYLSKNPPLEDKKQVLIIKGLENSIGFKDYPPILQNLNFVRDAFTYDVPYPILFCLQNDTITRFARFAPDFWAWKSGIFKFESLPEEKNIDRQFVNFARVLERDGVSETQARIDLLTRLFAEYSAEKNISMMITTLQQLGVAYYRRGELQKAKESLLEAWNLSNQITSLEPTKVATLETLGYVYKKLKKYEEAETIYQQVLNVYSEQNFSQKWAKIQNSLGNVYLDKNQGSKADNLERAIYCFNSALEVYTRDSFPSEWAMTQNNLGVAYSNRIRGERADNLELAIVAYNQSLEVYTRDSFPEQWAMTQNNLGNAYSDRIRGEKAENLELAIVAYNLSLEVYTCDSFHYEWAGTQNNLGNAYNKRIRGERAENLELAIVAYNLSLEVYTRDSFPSEWAMTQNNLGNAYSNRIRGERVENLELAIVAYNLSLEVYTRDSFPYEWAMTQNNLGNAYSDRIRGEKAENLELAIFALNQSLEVITPTAYPIDCLQTGRNLGNAANLIEDWETAIKGYNLAIEASEIILLEALNPQQQQEILSAAIDLYYGIVQFYLNLNKPDRALEYVERSKTRYLVQLLTERDIYPKGNIPQIIITELDRLRRAIIGEEQRLAIQEQTRNRGEILPLDQQRQPILNDYTHLNQLKQELNQLIDREITPIDPTFSLTQKVESIPLSEIQSLIDQDTAILEWYIAGDSIMAFIVTNEGLIPPNPPSKGGNSEVKGVKVWQSSAEDREKLIDFIKDYRDAYENNKTAWINNLNDCLNQLSEILHIDELLELIPKSCSRLILIPHWFLHIITLHCLPLKDGQFLYQRFSNGVGYVPSCQLLKLVKLSQRENFTRLFAIKNPTRKDLKPLLGANLEIERISQGFAAEKTIIIGESEASKQTLENRRQELQASHCLHFSCHGKFDNESPRDSALMLADPDSNLGESANLTLAEVFEKFDLRECRLVTLCFGESGIIESKADSISDEYVGLPSGFLFAGSSSVVSTLWTVDPLATTLFMTKFYHSLKRISIRDEGSIAIVLNHTQTWLKTLNSKKLARIKDNQKFQQLLDRVFENKRDRRKFQDLLEAAVKREPYPFANPYYWTAFIATGV